MNLFLSNNSSEATVQKQFVVLDQTFVVFDIEQPRDAVQKLKLNRLSGVGPVLWRFQTNAPTRYIVSPSSGYLADDEPVEITITLYKNCYRPRHELILQAIQAPRSNVIHPKTAWENAKNVQTAHLDLGTTVINIGKVMENQKASESPEKDLMNLLDVSSSKGEARVKELQDLIKLTIEDCAILEKNTAQTRMLKEVLKCKFEEKKKLIEEMKEKLTALEGSYMRKSAEVERLRGEMVHLNQTAIIFSPKTGNPSGGANKNCNIS